MVVVVGETTADDPVIFPDARYYYTSGQQCVANSESNTHNRYGTASSQSRAVNLDLWADCQLHWRKTAELRRDDCPLCACIKQEGCFLTVDSC